MLPELGVSSRIATVEYHRRHAIDCRVWTAVIVEADVACKEVAGGVVILRLLPSERLLSVGAMEPLNASVGLGVCHAGADVGQAKCPDEGMPIAADKLASAVMDDLWLTGLSGLQPVNGLLNGKQNRVTGHRGVEGPMNDEAAEGINDVHQIVPGGPHPHVHDVDVPLLIGAARRRRTAQGLVTLKPSPTQQVAISERVEDLMFLEVSDVGIDHPPRQALVADGWMGQRKRPNGLNLRGGWRGHRSRRRLRAVRQGLSASPVKPAIVRGAGQPRCREQRPERQPALPTGSVDGFEYSNLRLWPMPLMRSYTKGPLLSVRFSTVISARAMRSRSTSALRAVL